MANRTPSQIQKDIDKLKKELSDSKDANYYAAKIKKDLKQGGAYAKKYGKKAAKSTKKGAKSFGQYVKKLLTTK